MNYSSGLDKLFNFFKNPHALYMSNNLGVNNTEVSDWLTCWQWWGIFKQHQDQSDYPLIDYNCHANTSLIVILSFPCHLMFSQSQGHLPTWLSLFKYASCYPVSVGTDPLPVTGVVLDVLQAEVVLRQFGAVHSTAPKRWIQSRKKLGHFQTLFVSCRL